MKRYIKSNSRTLHNNIVDNLNNYAKNISKAETVLNMLGIDYTRMSSTYNQNGACPLCHDGHKMDQSHDWPDFTTFLQQSLSECGNRKCEPIARYGHSFAKSQK